MTAPTAPRPLIDLFTPEEREAFASADWGTAEDAAARGAQFLDREIPDWRERVQINTLQMSSVCNCVLGQIFSKDAPEVRHVLTDYEEQEIRSKQLDWEDEDDGYSPGIVKLGLTVLEDLPAIFLGFDIKTPATTSDHRGEWDYEDLQAAWQAILSA